MTTLAKYFLNRYKRESTEPSIDGLMRALDSHWAITSEQDFDAGRTTWTFKDGSRITIDGTVIEILSR